MAVFELITIDGRAVQPEKTVSADGFDEHALTAATPTERELLAQMRSLTQSMAQVMSAVLSQQAEIAKLNRALATIRVSRAQELAIHEAIRARARQLCAGEAMPEGAQRRVAGAIRTSLREITGARAAGDIQASQFEQVMGLISGWRMEGALRRIRREARLNGQP